MRDYVYWLSHWLPGCVPYISAACGFASLIGTSKWTDKLPQHWDALYVPLFVLSELLTVILGCGN